MVVDELDALRKTSEDCQTLAFADLSTQMILVTDSGSNKRREVLDDLCAEAALLLGAGGRPAFGIRSAQSAIVVNQKMIRFFIRAAAEPNDVLCCVCKPEVDVGAFLADAKGCLDRIIGGHEEKP